LADNVNHIGGSILVVDDEQIVLSLVEDTLTDDGYDVVTTLSANEAIELVKSRQFDFILTDIRMPEMNGIELVKEIHKISPTAGIIFMTGYANLDTAKQAIKEGAYDYIMKPFELSEIRQAISRAMEQKKFDSEATLSRELNKIADLSNMMYASGDLASLLQLSLSFAIIQSNAEAGTVVYFDRRNEEMVLMQSTKTFDGTDEVSNFDISTADWDSIQPVKSPILIQDETQHPLFGTPVFQTNRDKILPERFFASKAAVIVPLIRSEKMLGFISMFHAVPDYRLKSSDTQFLNFISSQLTISLENLQLLEDSREAYRRLEYLQEQTLKMEKMATRGQMSTEIGHELNNYLGVVVANFQLMDLRIQKGVTEGLERFTESINDHLEKISRFAKGLMDYSSLQKATFKTVNINLLLERIVEFLRPQKRFRDFDIGVTSDSDKPEAEIDHGLIEQVLYNLLNNAAEASANSETKKIEIKISGQTDDMIRLSIKDHGPGIAESKLKKIFREKFTTKESGHGIGLVVCKNIIDKHNGRIAVDSVPGEGTTFTIDLPIKHKVTDEAAVETA